MLTPIVFPLFTWWAMTLTADNLVLFGATGDLAQRMLLPSLFALHADQLVSPQLAILGTADSDLDTGSFRLLVEAALKKYLPADCQLPGTLTDFVRQFRYVRLDASDPRGFGVLSKAIGNGQTRNVAIFLSTAPSLFASTIAGLQHTGLTGERARIGLEKPLGHDLASRMINDAVLAAFPEERTFRIDHYLGKETVQNLLALRFGNRLFESLWNASGIEHIQITVAETVGLEGRGGLLRRCRRFARHGAESHAPAVGAGGDGAARAFQRHRGARREGEGVALAAPDRPRDRRNA